MLIEDEYFISYIYKKRLEAEQFQIDTFATAGEGLEALKQTPYDLLLLDMMLPDSDGIAMLRKIRAEEGLKNLPVIIMTNLSQDSVIQEAKALGVLSYIIKSEIAPDEMIEKIREALARNAS